MKVKAGIEFIYAQYTLAHYNNKFYLERIRLM